MHFSVIFRHALREKIGNLGRNKMSKIKHQLSQLSDLKREIKLLEQQIVDLKEQLYTPDKQSLSDTVKGSQTEWPFCTRTLIIVGDTPKIVDAKARIRKTISAMITHIWDLRAQCVAEVKRLTEWIDKIDDSQMRQILRLRYIKCESFQQIAFAIGETDESYPRRKLRDFLKAAENAESKVR